MLRCLTTAFVPHTVERKMEEEVLGACCFKIHFRDYMY
jgi:hypothetical protein